MYDKITSSTSGVRRKVRCGTTPSGLAGLWVRRKEPLTLCGVEVIDEVSYGTQRYTTEVHNRGTQSTVQSIYQVCTRARCRRPDLEANKSICLTVAYPLSWIRNRPGSVPPVVFHLSGTTRRWSEVGFSRGLTLSVVHIAARTSVERSGTWSARSYSGVDRGVRAAALSLIQALVADTVIFFACSTDHPLDLRVSSDVTHTCLGTFRRTLPPDSDLVHCLLRIHEAFV